MIKFKYLISYDINGDIMTARVTLGKADCNECGNKGCVVLVINEMGIFSVCKKCGFHEWEWSWGDSPDYLEWLSVRFNVSVERIKEALEWIHY